MLYQQRLISALFNIHKSENVESELSRPHPALSVYRNNYIESGIRALSITYRTVLGIMDESNFRLLVSAYLNKYPKTCFDWADYGENLSEFMFDIDQLSHMPFLPELAEIDWRLMRIERSQDKVFDAASFGLMETHSTEDLIFDAAPGLQTMQVFFPVQELYRLVHEFDFEDSAQNTQTNKKLLLDEINNLLNSTTKSSQQKSIVLWRKEYKGLFEYSDINAHKAFQGMISSKSIAKVLSYFGEDQTAMTNWLQAHIQSKKIYALKVNK